MDFIGRFQLREINWEQESYSTYGDFVVLPLFALFFPSVRFFLDRFVFEKVGTQLIIGKCQRLSDVEGDDRKKIRKFKESACKCVYYVSAEVLAQCVTYNESWFTNTRYFWEGPADEVWPDQNIKLKLKGLYLYAAGFYTLRLLVPEFCLSKLSKLSLIVRILLKQWGSLGQLVVSVSFGVVAPSHAHLFAIRNRKCRGSSHYKNNVEDIQILEQIVEDIKIIGAKFVVRF